jgi:hypothetical protein
MDIAEKRKPQDGRIGLAIDGRDVDVRASILPGSHGETMVLRLLDRSKSLLSLKDLGFEDEDYRWFRRTSSARTDRARHGADGLGEDDDAVRGPLRAEPARREDHHGRDPVEYHIAGSTRSRCTRGSGSPSAAS